MLGTNIGKTQKRVAFCADEFGAVVANLAATARKAFTLSVSFLFFPKPFTTVHAIGTYAIV